MIDVMSMGPNDCLPTAVTLLDERAASSPEQLFLQDVTGGQATYSTAREAVWRWAAALDSLGIGAGTTVATMNPNSVASTLLWLGLAAARAWEAPVHPLYRGYMLEHAVENVRAETVFADFEYLDRFAASASNLSHLKRIVVLGSQGRPLPALPFETMTAEDLLAAATTPRTSFPAPEAWDVAAIVYTSGTTGRSKGVMVPWGQLGAFAIRMWPIEDLSSDDVLYVFTPSSHVGSKILTYLTALLGCRLVIRSEFKTQEFLSDVKTFGVTTTVLVGTIARFLEHLPPQPEDGELPLRNVAMAPLIPDLEGFQRRFGVRVCSGYSSTELSAPISSAGWKVENWMAAGKQSAGWPWFEVRVVDEHDREVDPGTVGELIVRTGAPWTLNLGYFGMPDATATAWRNGWFHTGDGFSYDEDGYFYFRDRLKDTIRRRGENISSFEIEAIVNEHPSVLESAAVAVPSELGEDEVMIWVVPRPNQPFAPEALTEFLVDRMPPYMVPRYVAVADELPKTVGTLRVQKAELRARGVTPSTWDRAAMS